MTGRNGDRGKAAAVTAAPAPLPCHRVLGMRVDQIESDRAARLIAEWAADVPGRGRTICAANVHMSMQAHDDPAFAAIVNSADLVLPDGVPMVWALRASGLPQARRVRVAPDLLVELLVACEARGVRVGLLGGTPQSLAAFVGFLAEALPGLAVPYAWSPPFRPLTPQEDVAATLDIRGARVQLLLVGIGCPKQERWMAAHANRLDCVMFGVGAAFDMFAGRTGNAPGWMRDLGLEWVYRLAAEPRRLWRRYLLGNPRFMALFARQLARECRRRRV